MAVEWFRAEKPVLDMAQRIIAEYHPRLADARILFIMRSEAPVSNGRVTYGKAKKVSAELQVHVDADFIIWFAKDQWLYLRAEQREALMDHELSHCQWDGLTASMRPHDVEEFTHIIERHGFWWPYPKPFIKAVQAALPLPPSPDEPRREGGVATFDPGTIDFDRVAADAQAALQVDGE